MNGNAVNVVVRKYYFSDNPQFYFRKCLTEFGPGLALVGKATPEPPSEDLIHAIQTSVEVFYDREENIKVYKRALINGHMFHSATYTKVSQRNSYTVEFRKNEFGKIILYVVLGDSAYALVHPYKQIPANFCRDNLTGKLGCNLTVVTNDNSDNPILVPLKDVKQKVIIIKRKEDFVVVRFPNFIEKD